MSEQVPRLSTSRLYLRPLGASDVDAYATMMADADVTRYLGDGRTLDRAEAWRQLALFIGHWELRGFGMWGVEERESGRFLGRIGCYEPEGWPGFEIGYVLARDAWGRGYAREGVAAALTFAQRVLGKTDVISLIRPANTASIAVAASLGARRTGRVEFFGGESAIYRYPQWLKA
jgi:RimJ/RimL family protein N-acetyltransferase